MNSGEYQRTSLYVRNVLLKVIKILTTHDPFVIDRDNEYKINLGAGITITRFKRNPGYFYFNIQGSQLFNLDDTHLFMSGADKLCYADMKEKDQYFNAMINDTLGTFRLQDFENMEIVFNKLKNIL